MTTPTADLCDEYGDAVRVLDGGFTSYGGVVAFGGPISTVAAFEDNSLVREALAEPGGGRVLVVAGGGSSRCAMVGGNLAEMAALAAPDDARVHEIRAEVFQRRRDGETSLMAKGIFGFAANESRDRAGT